MFNMRQQYVSYTATQNDVFRNIKLNGIIKLLKEVSLFAATNSVSAVEQISV